MKRALSVAAVVLMGSLKLTPFPAVHRVPGVLRKDQFSALSFGVSF